MNRRQLMPADVRLETQRATTARGMRRPTYDAQGQMMSSGCLYPLAYAPVLAGDTVKTASYSLRCHSAPSAHSSPMINFGVWWESWIFYVRVGDMASAETIRERLVDPNASGDPIDFRQECMDAIWKGYFCDEGQDDEEWAFEKPLRVHRDGWWSSIQKASDLPDVSAAPDDWNEKWIRFQAMRRAKLTTKTFEEYLAAQGVSVPPQLRVEHDAEMKMPELLHYSREFAYPQATGASNTSGQELYRYQFFIQEKIDRGRFCAEPGFLVWLCAMRPKVYVEPQAAFDPLDLLQSAEGWMPIDLDTDPHASLVEVPGTLIGDTVPGAVAVMDGRDLFLYGDQVFANPMQGSVSKVDLLPGGYALHDVGQYAYGVEGRLALNIASRVSRDATQ